MRKTLPLPSEQGENIREANVGTLEGGYYGVHHAPLPRPIVGPECCATIHVHRHAAFPNKHGTLAKRAVTGLHEGTNLCGEIVTGSLVAPVKSLEWVHTLSTTRQQNVTA
jgi:hypothetical protein